MRVRFWAAMAAMAVTLGATAPAVAQSYPERDITMIVPFNPGGVVDPAARAYAGELSKILGVGVNIENQPGGSGTIGATAAFSAAPDGYTVGYVTANILSYQPIVNPDFIYKTTDDYVVIGKMVETPSILVVKADAPWKTLEEFLQAARDNPGGIRAAVSGLRTAGDLSMQELNLASGAKVTTVPFTGGGGEALVALLGGRVEALVGTTTSAKGHVDSGEVRVLAVFKDGKFDIFPDAQPTVQAGYDAKTPQSFYVATPKGISDDVRQKLVEATAKVSQSEEYRKFLAENGYVVDAKNPDDAIAELKSDAAAYAELVAFMEKQGAQ